MYEKQVDLRHLYICSQPVSEADAAPLLKGRRGGCAITLPIPKDGTLGSHRSEEII